MMCIVRDDVRLHAPQLSINMQRDHGVEFLQRTLSLSPAREVLLGPAGQGCRGLNVSNNSFTGPIPTDICRNLNSIRILDFWVNKIGGTPR